MRSTIYLCLLAICFIACVSENEQKGLDYIADLYDAETSYSKSFNNSVGTKAMKKFNVKVSGSARIDTLEPTVTTANIAMLMFESFTEKEKGNYTHIDVELINSKNDTAAYYYPVDILEELSTKSNSYKQFSQSLVDNKFEVLDEIKDATHIPNKTEDGLKSKIRAMEQRWGKLRSYEPFGIAEATDDMGTIYQFQGYLIFGNGVRKPYFTVAEAQTDNHKLIGFRIF